MSRLSAVADALSSVLEAQQRGGAPGTVAERRASQRGAAGGSSGAAAAASPKSGGGGGGGGSAALASVGSQSALSAAGGMLSAEEDAENRRLRTFYALVHEDIVDLAALKKLSWNGVPAAMRADAWRLMLDYSPAQTERRAAVLQRKRAEYAELMAAYGGGAGAPDATVNTLRHQIHIDVKRAQSTPLFAQKRVRRLIERVLFLWSVRHPGPGYVQGINDLCMPFAAVFLSECIDGDVLQGDVERLSDEQLQRVEADCYWCLSKFLANMQDHFTMDQPGIQKQLAMLRNLISRVDGKLLAHLETAGVQFVQFAFRWFNCLLMREFPLRLILRLFDTYLSEGSDFIQLHLYVCGAYLLTFSKKLVALDFQNIIMLLQNPPTEGWTVASFETVLSSAFILKEQFSESPSHFRDSMTRQA